MNPTKNEIPMAKRTALDQLLIEWVSKQVELQPQRMHCRWNVKRPTFPLIFS